MLVMCDGVGSTPQAVVYRSRLCGWGSVPINTLFFHLIARGNFYLLRFCSQLRCDESGASPLLGLASTAFHPARGAATEASNFNAEAQDLRKKGTHQTASPTALLISSCPLVR